MTAHYDERDDERDWPEEHPTAPPGSDSSPVPDPPEPKAEGSNPSGDIWTNTSVFPSASSGTFSFSLLFVGISNQCDVAIARLVMKGPTRNHQLWRVDEVDVAGELRYFQIGCPVPRTAVAIGVEGESVLALATGH